MIKILNSSVFESDANAIVIPVNCEGGKFYNNLVARIAKEYPYWLKDYYERCNNAQKKVKGLNNDILRIHRGYPIYKSEVENSKLKDDSLELLKITSEARILIISLPITFYNDEEPALDDVIFALKNLLEELVFYEKNGMKMIKKIAFTKLLPENSELDWASVVKPLLFRWLTWYSIELETKFEIYDESI